MVTKITTLLWNIYCYCYGKWFLKDAVLFEAGIQQMPPQSEKLIDSSFTFRYCPYSLWICATNEVNAFARLTGSYFCSFFFFFFFFFFNRFFWPFYDEKSCSMHHESSFARRTVIHVHYASYYMIWIVTVSFHAEFPFENNPDKKLLLAHDGWAVSFPWYVHFAVTAVYINLVCESSSTRVYVSCTRMSSFARFHSFVYAPS